MNSFINLLKKCFMYSPHNSYEFVLNENNTNKNSFSKEQSFLPDCDIYSHLDETYKYLQVQFNTLINSDIILRPFTIKINNKKYNALFLGIDGLIDSELVNNFLLRPLMETNTTLKINKTRNGIEYSKFKKINLEDYIFDKLLPQNTVKKITKFSEVASTINSGDGVLFIDTLNVAFAVDVKGFESRSISSPKNEIVVRGSQEAFVEKLRTNTSILRRIISSPNLVIENTIIGNSSKTKVAICYMKNIANDSLVSEVKYRLDNLDVDYIISSGTLEQLIQDNSRIAFPQIIATERPDKAANHLLEGRVVIIVNGSPYSLIAPGILLDFLSSPEDLNLKHQYANLLKIVRLLAALITLLLPGLYVAILNFHTELVPTELLFTIAGSRNNVPFPVVFEVLLMEISFELIREAGLRIPSPIGPTIGIIGALILGDAAVTANLVSPISIIIVAITGIGSFAIPDFSLNFTFRIYKFIYIFLGYIAGFLGIAIGLFTQLSILCNLTSYGVSYLEPYIPITNFNGSLSYFLHAIWKRENRSDFLNTKDTHTQAPISRKWKFWNSNSEKKEDKNAKHSKTWKNRSRSIRYRNN